MIKNKICVACLTLIIGISNTVAAFAEPLNQNRLIMDIEQETISIYTQKLLDAGLVSETAVLNNISDIAYFTDDDEKTFSEVNAYIDVDGHLENAYDVIYRSVATGRTGTLTNTDVMGFVITVNYNYYYPSLNGYQDPYYQHGSLRVKASNSSNVESIDDFKCVYLSRGIETDSEGNWQGNFIEAASRINGYHLSVGETWNISGSNIGKPYIAKNSSTIPNGTAFSGIAYSFNYNGVEYKDTNILFYDESNFDIYLEDFDWFG